MLLACACRAGADATAPERQPVVVEARDIPYASQHHKQALDVYAPEGARSAPVVMFVHGGYWVSGDRRAPEHGAELYQSIGKSLARRGFVAVIPSYRLAPEVKAAGMLDDVARALAWTYRSIDERGGDSWRIYLMGHSAGGQLVSMLALDDTWLTRHQLPRDVIQGTIAASSIWDLVAMRDAQPQRFNRRVTYRVFGRDDAALQRYSPIHHVTERRRPFLLIVGERDFDYLVPQAAEALDRLHAANTEATLRIIRGYDHLDVVRRFGRADDPIIDHLLYFVHGP